MEAFGGLFICSTNLMEALDEAALRRFDLKIRFDYLTPTQARELLLETLGQRDLGTGDPAAAALRARPGRLTTLTPGDFATVLRRAHVLGRGYDAEGLVRALEEDCRAKQRGPRPVAGFVGSCRPGGSG